MVLETLGRSEEPLDMATVDQEAQIIDFEHDKLLRGEWTPVIGNDDKHVQRHGTVVDSDVFRNATSQAQIAFLTHLSSHILKRAGGPVRIEQGEY